MKKVKVFIVDDQQIIRDGLKALLSIEEYIDIIDEASNGDELLNKLKHRKPDILLLDIDLPGMSGIELLKIISTDYPELKVLMLSMYMDESHIFDALKYGAKGYIPKNTSKEVLFKAINEINEGNEFLDEKISRIITKSYIKTARKADDKAGNKINLLSAQELTVLKQFAEGKSNQEIADKLFISIRTVESHKNHIMQKLDFKTYVDLIKFALKNHIIEL